MDGLKALFERMLAEGWPLYCDDPDLCMARAREFLDAADKLKVNDTL